LSSRAEKKAVEKQAQQLNVKPIKNRFISFLVAETHFLASFFFLFSCFHLQARFSSSYSISSTFGFALAVVIFHS
jgi:hypothetical protein